MNDVELRERDYWCAGKAFVRNFHMKTGMFYVHAKHSILKRRYMHLWDSSIQIYFMKRYIQTYMHFFVLLLKIFS